MKTIVDQNEPLSLDQFVAECSANTRSHVKIIGWWASCYPPICSTRGQWGLYLRRCARAAVDLSLFSPDQINDAMTKLQDEAKRLGYTPTLETLLKKLLN